MSFNDITFNLPHSDEPVITAYNESGVVTQGQSVGEMIIKTGAGRGTLKY